ncbi:MAG: hypothetical protein RLZ10_216 [Bacteroidota bacterium]|jgi:hypothetical protein
MKKLLLFLILCSSGIGYAQLREFYSGLSLSNYFWGPPYSEMNQFKYSSGFQAGYMVSPKLKIFRFLTSNRISPYTAIEYSNSNLLMSNGNKIQLHSVRGSFPVRIKLIKDKNNLRTMNVLVEPGVNVNFFQQNLSRGDLNLRVNPLDCYMNVGIGGTFNKKEKKVEKAGYKFIGISVYASKYIPVKFMKAMTVSSTGFLDQIRVNVGLRFSYQEPPKKGIIKKNNSKKKKN